MNQINLNYFKLISQHRFMCLYDQFSLNHVNLILLISKVVFFLLKLVLIQVESAWTLNKLK